MSKAGELTAKQKSFVDNYLVCLNGAEAARRAGYSPKTAHAIGAENLSKPIIKSAIDKRIADNAMSANEVLTRLSDMARASLDDVLDLDDEFDLTLARSSGKMHLVKRIKRTQYTDEDGNTTRTTEVELHDAQAALVHLGKYHKLFANVAVIETWRDKLIDGLKKGAIAPEVVLDEFGDDLSREFFRAAGLPLIASGQSDLQEQETKERT